MDAHELLSDGAKLRVVAAAQGITVAKAQGLLDAACRAETMLRMADGLLALEAAAVLLGLDPDTAKVEEVKRQLLLLANADTMPTAQKPTAPKAAAPDKSLHAAITTADVMGYLHEHGPCLPADIAAGLNGKRQTVGVLLAQSSRYGRAERDSDGRWSVKAA